MMRDLGRRRATTWGDGFAEDGWSEMLSVRSWDDVDADAFLRVFPRLVPRDGRVPGPIADMLAACVAAWEVHVAAWSGGDGVCRTSLGEAERTRLGPPRHAVMFASRARFSLRTLWGQDATRGPRPGAADEWLGFLDDVLQRVRQGAPGTAAPTETALFAFLTGIHPAYVWPAALVTQDRDAAAGWLGIVARGRAALMPADVADYVVDVFARDQRGAMTIRDGQIARFLGTGIAPGDVWRAACARRRGTSVVVRSHDPWLDHNPRRRLPCFAGHATVGSVSSV